MSALTKLFVVLAVVLSLLLTSGLIVFVNKMEDVNKKYGEEKKLRQLAESQKLEVDAQMQALRGETARAIDAADKRATAADQQFNTQLASAAQLQGRLAESTAAAAKAGADANIAIMAMKAAQEAYKAADVNLTSARKENDDLRIKYGEATVATTDLTNKLDQLNARYRKVNEDITELERQNTDLRTSGRTVPFGGTAGAQAAPGASRPGLVQGDAANLKGVVRAKKNIQGVEYATISLGSTDQVAKGMQFKVLDRGANQFLGYITIDTVEYNESTGHLSGPNVSAVRPGVEVVTSLQ